MYLIRLVLTRGTNFHEGDGSGQKLLKKEDKEKNEKFIRIRITSGFVPMRMLH